MVVDGKTAGTGALGEQRPLLRVRVKGELERDGSREDLAGVRKRCLRSHTITTVVSCDTTGAILEE